MKRILTLCFLAFALSLQAKTPVMSFDMRHEDKVVKWIPQIVEISGKRIHMVLIPEKQTQFSWREELEQLILFTGKSTEEAVAAWEKEIQKDAKDATFEKSTLPDGSVLVDFTCKSKYQSGIRRFMKGPDGIYTVAYYVRPILREKERVEFWLNVLKNTKLVPNKHRKDALD